MNDASANGRLASAVPSIDDLLRNAGTQALIDAYGRELITELVREAAAQARAAILKQGEVALERAATEARWGEGAARGGEGMARSVKP